MNRNPDMPADVLAQIQKIGHEMQKAIRLAQEASFSSGTRIEMELYTLWLRLARIQKTAESTTDMDMRKER